MEMGAFAAGGGAPVFAASSSLDITVSTAPDGSETVAGGGA